MRSDRGGGGGHSGGGRKAAAGPAAAVSACAVGGGGGDSVKCNGNVHTAPPPPSLPHLLRQPRAAILRLVGRAADGAGLPRTPEASSRGGSGG